MCPMINGVLHANEVPRGPEGLANKLPSQTFLPAKVFNLKPTLRSGYGMLCIHFPSWTTNKLFGTMDCLFQDPL